MASTAPPLSNTPASLQDKEQELEQLTKELRQVNLQQFIQQTGTKVSVLPAEPIEVEASHVDVERGEMWGNLGGFLLDFHLLALHKHLAFSKHVILTIRS